MVVLFPLNHKNQGFSSECLNAVGRKLSVMCCIFGLIFFHFRPPVSTPPTKANPRDEAKAAACMAASPLKKKRRQDRDVRTCKYSVDACFFGAHVSFGVRLKPLPFFLPQSHSYDPSQPPQDARHAMQIVDPTGVLDTQAGCQDGLQRRKQDRKKEHFIPPERNSIKYTIA